MAFLSVMAVLFNHLRLGSFAGSVLRKTKPSLPIVNFRFKGLSLPKDSFWPAYFFLSIPKSINKRTIMIVEAIAFDIKFMDSLQRNFEFDWLG